MEWTDIDAEVSASTLLDCCCTIIAILLVVQYKSVLMCSQHISTVSVSAIGKKKTALRWYFFLYSMSTC